jgi:hypothetical protein
MKKGVISAALLLLVLIEFSVFSKSEKEEPIHRYAMVIGANYGGPNREVLRYAVSDARLFMHVMEQMGGIRKNDSVLLVDPTIDSVNAGMRKIRDAFSKIRNTDRARTEFIFYYSGHSDEESLLLGSDKLSYNELRRHINSMPADVRIAILDSCSSGAFTRIKGGKMLTPFMSDPSYNMKGYAYMTSSSSDEVSQESERIRGSFFTHYLITGLRGAADMTQDGRITLNEAYQYAYRETLFRTEKTVGGPQHPNYNIQMSGTGDVILTDIRENSSILMFSESVSGRLYINNSNSIVAEVNKDRGETLSIALDEGRYTVLKESSDGDLSEAKVTVRKGSKSSIISASFSISKREIARSRGTNPVNGNESNKRVDSKFGFYLLPVTLGNPDELSSHNIVLHLFGCNCDSVRGVMFGLGLAVVRHDAGYFNMSLIGNIIGGDSKYVTIGGIFNITNRNSNGFQFATLTNATLGDMNGMQLSALANVTGHDTYGYQLSGLVNITSNNLYGIQQSFLANINKNDMKGGQLTVLFNYNGNDANGFQASVCNITRGQMNGLQIGGFNYANEQRWVQIGLINWDGNAHGMQIGLVNYADQNDGFPIGLVSIVRNGTTNIATWADETTGMYAGIRHGNNRIFNVYTVGYNRDIKAWGAGLGIGAQAHIGDFAVLADFLAFTYPRHDFSEKNSLRLSVSYSFWDRATVFAGVSYNHMYVHSPSGNNPEPAIGKYTSGTKHSKNRFWPGCFIGLQY